MNTGWDYLANIRVEEAIYQSKTNVERVELF